MSYMSGIVCMWWICATDGFEKNVAQAALLQVVDMRRRRIAHPGGDVTQGLRRARIALSEVDLAGLCRSCFAKVRHEFRGRQSSYCEQHFQVHTIISTKKIIVSGTHARKHQ